MKIVDYDKLFYPWLRFEVIAMQILMGYCLRSISIGKVRSVGMNLILGIISVFPEIIIAVCYNCLKVCSKMYSIVTFVGSNRYLCTDDSL